MSKKFTKFANYTEFERIKAAKGNPFEILDVGYDAEDDEIKTAYKKLAIRCHPDKQRFEPGTTESEKAVRKTKATEAFKAVSTAYVTMSNPSLREGWEVKLKTADMFSPHPQPPTRPKPASSSPHHAPAASYKPKSSPPSQSQSTFRRSPPHTDMGSLSTNCDAPPPAYAKSHQDRIGANASPVYQGSNSVAPYHQESRVAAPAAAAEKRSFQADLQPHEHYSSSPAGGFSRAQTRSLLKQDPFAMFEDMMGNMGSSNAGMIGGGDHDDGFGAQGAMTTSNNDPWALFNSMFDAPDTTHAAQNFIDDNSGPLNPTTTTSSRAAPHRRNTDPNFAAGSQAPQRQPQSQRGNAMTSFGGGGPSSDPFSTMSNMFSQLAGGMAGMDDFMSGEDPNRRGGMMTSRDQKSHVDRFGNVRQGRQERSMGMMDMGMNGRMTMESSFTMQTFQSGGGNRMSSQPQHTPMSGNSASSTAGRSAPLSTPRSYSSPSASASPFAGAGSNRSTAAYGSGSDAGSRRSTTSTFRPTMTPARGPPASSSLGGYGNFRMSNAPMQSMY